MSKVGGRRPAARSPHTRRQQEVLKALEAAARRVGLKVSAGQLRFAGLKLKGGNCLLRGRQWLVLDTSQSFDDQVDLYRHVLSFDDLVACELPTEMLDLLRPYLDRGRATGEEAA